MPDRENIHPSKVGSSGSGVPSHESVTGSPGRTPGTAEGDRETVEEDLRRQEQQTDRQSQAGQESKK
jgi:hypothetical protein